ncbi:MAG: DciA family protein [Pseudomonadota bacterium]
MSKKYSRTTAADIVRKLPLNQQLDASQAELIKLTPAWLEWARQALPLDCINHYQLNSVRHGKLVIVGENASSASQLKHLSQSLLEFLHEQGFAEIERITVRIQHPTQHFDTDSAVALAQLPSADFVTPSDASLKSIDNCQKMVKSEQLADALAKLADTLRSKK